MAQTPTPVFRRTVYYIQPKGYQVQFTGFAHVTTSLGVMVEPFEMNHRHTHNYSYVDYDPSDPIARIDKLQQLSEADAPFYDGEGTKRKKLHGGNIQPRVLIKTGNYEDA